MLVQRKPAATLNWARPFVFQGGKEVCHAIPSPIRACVTTSLSAGTPESSARSNEHGRFYAFAFNAGRNAGPTRRSGKARSDVGLCVIPKANVANEVASLGGPKTVACRLWPDKDPLKAGSYLSACLNPNRKQRLSDEEVASILQWASEKR